MQFTVEKDAHGILHKRFETRRDKMNAQKYKAGTKWKLQALAAGLLLTVAWLAGGSGSTAAGTVAEDSQMTFATPADAGQALLAAARADDEPALAQILGTNLSRIFGSANPAANENDRDLFVAQYNQMNRWVPMTDGTQVLHIGADNFPFPVPVALGADARWRFDSTAGEQELLTRRIGENELLAIDACVAIDRAENEYLRKPRAEGAEYTARIISSPGKRDGLYWQVAENHRPSPLGRVESFAPSTVASAASGGPVVIDGYSYRILTAQTENADGGAKNYMVNGKLTRGFAVLATPVKYGETGIMSFILGPEGFFERDLGSATSGYGATTKEFDPTDDWTVVE
jgi:Protein of unknown function (DUF2950)